MEKNGVGEVLTTVICKKSELSVKWFFFHFPDSGKDKQGKCKCLNPYQSPHECKYKESNSKESLMLEKFCKIK